MRSDRRIGTILLIVFFVILLASCQKNFSEIEEPQPAWIADAVFYQIFPERFRNGDPTNDPDKKSLFGSYPHDTTSEWHISPWTADWYRLQPWEKKNGKGLAYNLQRRRYGGDLQGVIEKLDYLKDLGINAIYLNPVFESPSLHKYDAATYIHIDDNFGPNPGLDQKIIKKENPSDPLTWQWTSADSLFLELIRQAHLRGIKIIIDGVFNHVGITHWAFLDVKKNGPLSHFKDWFYVLQWDDPKTPEDEFRYKGWMGVKELPELKEDEHGLIAPIRNHIFAVVERWMDPNGDGDPSDGIDGWRLDVAEMIDHDFWKLFRLKVKTINPQAYITGEIFWEDWQNNKLMNPAPWLKGDEFDGVMNYQWAALVTRYFIDQKEKISAEAFVEGLKKLDQRYKPRFRFQQLNLMDSHDTERLASNITNPDFFYDKGVSPFNPQCQIRKPNVEERKIQRLIALFQFTYPGPPMIYYGTESGMWGGDDPDCRKPMVWSDMVYEPESVTVGQQPKKPDSVYFDFDLFHYYQTLIKLRKSEIALRKGEMKILSFDNEKDVLAFLRTFGDQQILVVINNNPHSQQLELEEIADCQWKNLLTQEMFKSRQQKLKIKLAGKQGAILKRI